MADIPSGAGLGSSGTFTVGPAARRLRAQARARHRRGARRGGRATSRSTCSASRSASRTSTSPPSAGLTCFEFAEDGRVAVSPLAIDQATLHDLEEHLLLFFTGYSRSAGDALADQNSAVERGRRSEMLDNLDQTKQLGGRDQARARGRKRRRLRRADERALGAQAQALGRDLERGDRPLVRGRDRGRGDRRQARRRRRAAASCSSTRPSPARCGPRWRPRGSDRDAVPFDLDGSVVLVRE